MKQKSLISIIVISYNNYHYIYDCIDSILNQDYPNIEIIISNDGSKDFNKKTVENYIKNSGNKNIKRFIVNNNIKNLGTVKSINKAIKLSTGNYITLLAADDILYNTKVFSNYINSFNKLNSKELIVVSQLGMYDIKLKKLLYLFISEENKEKIINLPPKKLFAEMTTKCILPGPSICYKREIFKKYGYFDEKYILVEDYSSELKLSRLGIRYNYSDFISAKHRDGGISHGNIIGETHKSKQYDLDILNIFENEVLPFLELLNEKQKQEFLKTYQNLKWKFEYKYFFEKGSKSEKRKFLLKNYKIIFSDTFKEFIKDIKDQLKGKKIKIFILGFLIFTIFCLKNNYQNGISSFFSSGLILTRTNFIGFLGIFLIFISIILMNIYFIKKYLPKFIKFIKFIL